jgi:hypothetical protein
LEYLVKVEEETSEAPSQENIEQNVGQITSTMAKQENKYRDEGESDQKYKKSNNRHNLKRRSNQLMGNEISFLITKFVHGTDERHPNFALHKKHVFVLSNAGKPIFTRFKSFSCPLSNSTSMCFFSHEERQ